MDCPGESLKWDVPVLSAPAELPPTVIVPVLPDFAFTMTEAPSGITRDSSCTGVPDVVTFFCAVEMAAKFVSRIDLSYCSSPHLMRRET